MLYYPVLKPDGVQEFVSEPLAATTPILSGPFSSHCNHWRLLFQIYPDIGPYSTRGASS